MLSLRDLRKSYGSIVAVDGLSLEIARGEVFGLLGPNGAGKSTTISMAVGLLKPDSGSVTLDVGGGRAGPPTQPAMRAHVGVAPQALALYEEMSGEENLRFFGRLYAMPAQKLRERVAKVLAMVGLADRAKDAVKGYSGGMQRRLNLAVALIHDPPLLMLDEPTAGVDPQSRNSILDLVRDLAAQGRTIVYTTHYMEEAARLCTRVGIVDHGKLLALGSVDELIAAHGGRSVVVVKRHGGDERVETDDPLREIERVLKAGTGAAGAEGEARGVRIDRPDLESVFLRLTGRRLRD